MSSLSQDRGRQHSPVPHEAPAGAVQHRAGVGSSKREEMPQPSGGLTSGTGAGRAGPRTGLWQLGSNRASQRDVTGSRPRRPRWVPPLVPLLCVPCEQHRGHAAVNTGVIWCCEAFAETAGLAGSGEGGFQMGSLREDGFAEASGASA